MDSTGNLDSTQLLLVVQQSMEAFAAALPLRVRPAIRTDAFCAGLASFLTLLAETNEVMNLTSDADPRHLLATHIRDSLAPLLVGRGSTLAPRHRNGGRLPSRSPCTRLADNGGNDVGIDRQEGTFPGDPGRRRAASRGTCRPWTCRRPRERPARTSVRHDHRQERRPYRDSPPVRSPSPCEQRQTGAVERRARPH